MNIDTITNVITTKKAPFNRCFFVKFLFS